MNSFEQTILQAAEVYKNPETFLYVLGEMAVQIQPDRKGDFFLQVGILLAKTSNLHLALSSLKQALKYFRNLNDKTGEAACNGNIGIVYRRLGELEKAIECYKRALKFAQESGDKLHEVTTCINLAVTHQRIGNFAQAIELNKIALKINDEIGDDYIVSVCNQNLGNIYLDLSDFNKTIEYCTKALKIASILDNKEVLSGCYVNLGSAYHQLGEVSKGREYFEKALKVKIAIGDRLGESMCYSNLAESCRLERNFDKALEYVKKALELQKKIGDGLGESTCYGILSEINADIGKVENSINYLEKSLEIKRDIGDKAGESKCYTRLADIYDQLANFNKALECAQKALVIQKILDRNIHNSIIENSAQIVHIKNISALNVRLGHVYCVLGHLETSIMCFEEALKAFKRVNDKMGESISYGGLCLSYNELGNFRNAIAYAEKALEIANDFSDRIWLSKCYANLGLVYGGIGDSQNQATYFKKALESAQGTGDKIWERTCYLNLGTCSSDEIAIELYEKSLKIAEEVGDKVGMASSYLDLGEWHRRIGNVRSATSNFQKSLEIVKEINHLPGIIKCYISLGHLYVDLKEFDKATDYYIRALDSSNKIGDIESCWRINFNLGLVHRENNPQFAYSYFKNSLELAERIGGELIEEPHKIGYYARIVDVYSDMISLCWKLEKTTEMFEYTEGSKSRTFRDLISNTYFRPSGELAKHGSLLRREEECLKTIRQIQTRHLQEKEIKVEPDFIDNVFRELDAIYDEMEENNPEYVSMRRSKSISVEKIQSVLAKQKVNSILIEYLVISDRVFAYVITPSEFYVESIEISEEKLRRLIQNYEREVVHYSSFGDIGDTWLEIGNHLIDPLSKYLTKCELIYFVPSGLLHYLPLHALQLNGDPIIKNHAIAYLPSAFLLDFCKKKGTNNITNCASFGVIFEEEAKEIAKLFATEAQIGRAVTKENVKKALHNSGLDVIHFSCHGRFDEYDSLSSGILLHNDERLTAREVFELSLNTELVTLSACQTGINDRKPGDELIGLTRAFLYAGTSSILVSLWSVNARSTQELMVEFYTRLKKGIDKAQALQQAQNEIRKKDEYSHPYFWAPFILVGDWE